MEKKQDCVSMFDRVWICIIFNKILRLRQCPQYTLNNLLLNFIEHMKKWGGQLDIRPPTLKIGGDVSPPSPPGLTPLFRWSFRWLLRYWHELSNIIKLVTRFILIWHCKGQRKIRCLERDLKAFLTFNP